MGFTPTGVEFVAKNLNSYLNQLSKASKAQIGLGDSATSASGKLLNAGKSVAAFGIAAGAAGAAAGVTALAAGLGASVKTAISFESAFAGVIKTTDGLTDATGKLSETGKELRKGFVDLSKDIPLTFEELAHIGELGGQLGIGKDSLIDFTKTVAALGVSTNLSTEEAATAIARMQNIFQVAASDVGENTNQVGSAIVALGNNFATTERDIVAFVERLSGVGKNVGLSQADILAIGTALSSVGIQAEAGGTAVQASLIAMEKAVHATSDGFVDNSAAIEKNIGKLTKLQAESARLEAQFPGLQAELLAQHDAFIAAGGSAEEWGRQLGDKNRQKAYDTATAIANLTAETDMLRASQGEPIPAGSLETFAAVAGLTADEFRTKWEEDAAGAFNLFVQGLGAQGDEATKTLDKLGLDGARSTTTFLSLAGAGDLLSDALELSNQAFEEGTALQKEAAARYATTESQIQLLKNTFRALGDDIGSRFLPYINDTLTAFRDFISLQVGPFIDGLFAKFSELKSIFAAGGLFGSRAGSFGSIGLLTALGVPPDLQDALSTIISTVNNFIGEIQNIITTFQTSSTTQEGIFQTLFGVDTLQAAVDNIITSIPEKLSSVVTSITSYLTDQWPTIQATLFIWSQRFWDWATEAAAGAAQGAVIIISKLQEWAQSPETQAQLLAAGTAIGEAIVIGLVALAENSKDYTEFMTKVGAGLLVAIGVITGLLTAIGGQILAGIISGFAEKVGVELQPAMISELGPIFRGVADNAREACRLIGENVIAGFKQGFSDKVSEVGTTMEQLSFIIKHTVSDALGINSPSTVFSSYGVDIVQGMINGITSMLSSLTSAASGIFSSLFGGADTTSIEAPDLDLDIGTFTGAFPDSIANIQTLLDGLQAKVQLLSAYISATLPPLLSLGFTPFTIWLTTVTTQLMNIHSVEFPNIDAALQNTTSLWISGFNQVNTVLRETLSLLTQISEALVSVASNANKAVDALNKFKDAKEPFEDLIKLVDEATDSFKKLAEAAALASANIVSAGEGSAARTGIGFASGVGFANGTLGWKVPPGFNNDSYPIRVQSGEEVMVTPRGMTIEDAIARHYPNAGGMSINFGNVTITNGMDLAMFQNVIRETVSESFG